MSIRILVFALLVLSFSSGLAIAGPTCKGKFVNPVTDICWSCALPMAIGTGRILQLDQEDTDNVAGSPVCSCSTVPPTVGVKLAFWEPARQVDVTRTPWCFVGLGGLSIDPGIHAPRHAQRTRERGEVRQSFYQAHFYVNTTLYWLEVLLDFPCLEKGFFDIAYMTEVDPLWNDGELTGILNPEAILFANPVAVSACAIDCVQASTTFPLPDLFWCSGCQGALFPMYGWVSSHVGGVQASSLIANRLLAKMHRQLTTWSYAGERGLCGPYFKPIMDKTEYKYSMTYPIPQTRKIAGKCCQPLGRTTALWGAGREYPIAGEDFSYLYFRKRSCCAAYSVF